MYSNPSPMRTIGFVLLVAVLVFLGVRNFAPKDGTSRAAIPGANGSASFTNGSSSLGSSDNGTSLRSNTTQNTASSSTGVQSGSLLQVSSTSVSLNDGRYMKTGEQRAQTYNVDLDAGMAVVGQSYGFQGNNTGCQVFLIAGPFHGQVTVTDGESFVFDGGTLSSGQEESLLQQAAAKQASQGYGCSASNQHLTRLGG